MSRPANDEMVEGYRDGSDLNNPEPSTNRSHSYRHGFMVGRQEKLNPGAAIGHYADLRAAAESAMTKDEQS